MDEVKAEPDSEGEIQDSQLIKQESPTEEVPEPFAFAAVKIEAEVDTDEAVEVKVEPDIEVDFEEYHVDVNAVSLL
uniref:Uncharacterized protein n=1 Tax=Coptotermes formosanus TaxID=36987 RepID=R4V0U8_COPFO|nr:hypothetical protein [Coptotermes formosanus]